jgi:F0F1-type ATP synthase membrane subunit b/b'
VEHHLDLTSAVIIPYINFAIFLIAAVFLFRKPLAAMSATKREAYLKSSQEAAVALEQAKQTFEDTKTRSDALDEELRAFSVQSEQSSQEEAKRLLEETEKFTRHLRDETARLAVDAVESARLELRHEIVMAARQRAAERIQNELDPASKEKILKSKINETSKMTVQQ